MYRNVIILTHRGKLAETADATYDPVATLLSGVFGWARVFSHYY